MKTLVGTPHTKSLSIPRSRAPLLNCLETTVLMLTLFLARPSFCQGVSAGIKLGVPLADVVKTAGEIGGLPFEAETSRFAIGPVCDIRLPRGFALEFGAMYKRFDQHAGQIQVIGAPLQELSLPYTRAGRSWEFPIAGQYRFPGNTIRPYLEGGLSFNHLSSVLTDFRVFVPNPGFYLPGSSSENRWGPIFGAGMEIKLKFMRVSPGLRYTHYGETQPLLPSVHALDFIVGFTFR